jgi:hypothetical protein
MDFTLSDEQTALQELARKILADHLTHERLKTIEATPEWFDRKVWAELAKADLLGIALPEDVGGGGLGFIELCLLLEEIGRAVAPVPALPALVMGALPIAQFGTGEQRQRLLPGVVAGEVILTAALVETANDDPAQPTTVAHPEGSGWRLQGTKMCVPAAHLAERILVPARTTAGGVGVFLLDPRSAGVEMARQTTTSGEPQFQLTLSGANVGAGDILGDLTNGAGIVEWIVDRARVGICALEVGVTDRALRMTAQYTSTREQFGKPIATFQAVAQRAADAYVDVEAIRWTMWQAAWRLAAGLPATDEIAIAKFWAADAGHRVVYAAQHLHGGIGVDLDYPLHRYFLWSKQLELTLGAATAHLARLGARLAQQDVA